jgi:hypothetical protein
MPRHPLWRPAPDARRRPTRGADLHSTAAAVEELLALARALVRRPVRWQALSETDRLAATAAIEQVDWLLHQHWETLEDLAAERDAGLGEYPPQDACWRLAGGVRVRQTRSAALRRVADLARDELQQRRGDAPATGADSLQTLEAFLLRHEMAVDRIGTG